MSDFLNKFINKLEKEEPSMKVLNNVDYFVDATGWVSTGSPYLDYKLNTFGFPVGIIEVRGESQGGKTTLSLHGLKNFQQSNPDGLAVILSTERRDNKQYALDIGVNVDQVVVVGCKSIEDVFNQAQKLIDAFSEDWKVSKKAGRPKFFFVWDSLGNSVSAQEKNFMIQASADGNEDHHKVAMGSAARALKRGLRFMTAQIYDNEIWFVIINQVYDAMQAFSEKGSYGGKGIKYAPTLRIEINSVKTIKIGEEKKGQLSEIKVIKSDFNSCKDKFTIELMWGKGVILSDQDLDLAVEGKILEKVGKKYSFMGDKLTWDSKPGLYRLYDSKNKFLPILSAKILKYAHSLVVANRLSSSDNSNDKAEE